MIQCRARGVLRRYADATIRTPFCNCHGGQDCLNLFMVIRGNFQVIRRGHCKTDYMSSNLSDDMVLNTCNEDGGVHDDPISDHLDVWE